MQKLVSKTTHRGHFDTSAQAWTTPGDTILDKKDEMLTAAAVPANLAPFFLFGAIAVAVGAAGVLSLSKTAAEVSA